jgi:hypothetical protein
LKPLQSPILIFVSNLYPEACESAVTKAQFSEWANVFRSFGAKPWRRLCPAAAAKIRLKVLISALTEAGKKLRETLHCMLPGAQLKSSTLETTAL